VKNNFYCEGGKGFKTRNGYEWHKENNPCNHARISRSIPDIILNPAISNSINIPSKHEEKIKGISSLMGIFTKSFLFG